MNIPRGLTPLLIISCSLLLLALLVPLPWPNTLTDSSLFFGLFALLWAGQWALRPKKDQPLRLGMLIIEMGAAVAWMSSVYYLFFVPTDPSTVDASPGSIVSVIALFLTLGAMLWITVHFHLHPDESAVTPPPIDGN